MFGTAESGHRRGTGFALFATEKHLVPFVHGCGTYSEGDRLFYSGGVLGALRLFILRLAPCRSRRLGCITAASRLPFVGIGVGKANEIAKNIIE